MKHKYVAICPKCEIFITLKEYQPVYFCGHSLPAKVLSEETEISEIAPIEKIECKIVRIK